MQIANIEKAAITCRTPKDLQIALTLISAGRSIFLSFAAPPERMLHKDAARIELRSEIDATRKFR